MSNIVKKQVQHSPKIIAYATQRPSQKITMNEFIKAFDGRLSADAIEMLKNTGVESRYSVVENYLDYITNKSRRRLEMGCTELALGALKGCQKRASADFERLGMLIAITNTADRILPCLGYELVAMHKGINKEINVVNMQNQGCSVFPKAIELSTLYLASHPDRTVAIVIAEATTGFISANKLPSYKSLHELHQSPSNINTEMWRGEIRLLTSALFGDGAFAILLGNQGKCDYGKFFDFIHLTNLSSEDKEILRLNDCGVLHPHSARFPYYYMSEKVPKKGLRYTKLICKKLLEKNSKLVKSMDDFDYFLIHTGSKNILDAVFHTLKIKAKRKNQPVAYDVLAEYGNLSSAAVAYMLATLLDEKASGLGLIVSFGVGFSASAGIVKLTP